MAFLKSVNKSKYFPKGTNQFNSGLKTVITNPYNEDVKIVYFEIIPWFFRVYLNTLKIKDLNQNEIIKPRKSV
jgi:hypothetical protein